MNTGDIMLDTKRQTAPVTKILWKCNIPRCTERDEPYTNTRVFAHHIQQEHRQLHLDENPDTLVVSFDTDSASVDRSTLTDTPDTVHIKVTWPTSEHYILCVSTIKTESTPLKSPNTYEKTLEELNSLELPR